MTAMAHEALLAHRAICAASCPGDVPVSLRAGAVVNGQFRGSARHMGEVIRTARGNASQFPTTGPDACAVALVTAP